MDTTHGRTVPIRPIVRLFVRILSVNLSSQHLPDEPTTAHSLKV
ncbi:unnamed protein product [Ciceribacter sp. T2.26MG-112.2]|nr:unnamed protein product [Ciceribacter naphthalenivorans]